MPKRSGKRSVARKKASVSRMAKKCGISRVVVKCRSKKRSGKRSNPYTRYVKANFHKMKRSGEKATTVMKRIAKSWNAKK
jgi:hypothetical protein